MELIHRSIPREFLDVLPDGMKFVHRHGNEFLVVEELRCPNGHSLMSDSVRIHDEPSIGITIHRGESRNRIYIDAFWGSHAKLFDFLIDDTHATMYADAVCPTCSVSLVVHGQCGAAGCDSERRIKLLLPRPGDFISACNRLGCPDHMIVVGGASPAVTALVSEINFFGYGDDEAFQGI
ncbi:MAG: hypothetical protein EA382_05570 [Spirochaetaceae bacterium]|nr:MAG: hypothetical protein EA382_05570 [Spirochaetaceae bacterium]